MNQDGFGDRVKSGGTHSHRGQVYWLVHNILCQLELYPGFGQIIGLGNFFADACGLSAKQSRRSLRRRAVANHDHIAQDSSLADDQSNEDHILSAKRLLPSLFFVGFLWVAITVWLAAIQAMQQVFPGSKEAALTADETPYGRGRTDSSKSSYRQLANREATSRTYLLMRWRQMFNPAFGLARSEVSSLASGESIACANVNSEPELTSRPSTLLDESMIGEISMPTQTCESIKASRIASFAQASNNQSSLNCQQPSLTMPGSSQEFRNLADQLFLNTQKLEKPKPKMTIISR